MPAQQLSQAGRAFDDMAQREGVGNAFIAYSADDFTMIRPGDMPILGKTDLVEFFSKVTGSALTWEPIKTKTAASQDLGYTFGRYTLRWGDAIKTHGVSMTIRKKQPDGSWKFVFDGGRATPQELSKP